MAPHDLSPHNGASPTTELEQLQAAYAIILQRDGSAERHMYHWKLMALALLVITLGVGIWDHLCPSAIMSAI